MNFSEGIKYIRKVTYLSQESFAKEIGVSVSTVNRWNGENQSRGSKSLLPSRGDIPVYLT